MTKIKRADTFLGGSTSLYIVDTPTQSYCYAFSGVISGPGGSGVNTVLDFQTPNSPIKAQFQVTGDWDGMGSDQLFIDLFLNGVQVMDVRANQSSGASPHLNRPYHLILPPLTQFLLQVGVDSGSYGILFSGKLL